MAQDDSYKKFITRMVTRQKKPRNLKIGHPRSLGKKSRQPYPSNVLYQRPRKVNRTELDNETVAP